MKRITLNDMAPLNGRAAGLLGSDYMGKTSHGPPDVLEEYRLRRILQ
jgi:hypothetical protein